MPFLTYHLLLNVKDAVTLDGVKVTAYFAWSLMDNFEWADGYSVRFGMTYVDYKNNQARYLKDSAFWYSQFVKTQQINGDYYNPVYETLKSLEKKEAKFLESQE